MSVLTSKKVLILNKGWTAIRVRTVLEAVKLVFRDRAVIVDTDTYELYDWLGWIDLPVKDGDEFISSSSSNIKIPEVIVLTDYNKVPNFDIRLTKRNIYLRDSGICQYTGKKLGKHDYDVDHVIPKAQGGKNSWPNMVLCDKNVNRKKANRTPEEAGISLIRKPFKPKASTIMIEPGYKEPESWSKFLKR